MKTGPFKSFNRAKVAEGELRWRMRQVKTRDQFERLVLKAAHPAEVRAKLEPLLRKDLPCCEQIDGKHSLTCPVPLLVTL